MSQSLRRRLEPALIKQLVAEYESGTTPSPCETYGLSKTGILRLLRDEGVALRRRSLTDDQVEVTRELYEHGHPITVIAAHLDTSYNNVRNDLSRREFACELAGARMHTASYRATVGVARADI